MKVKVCAITATKGRHTCLEQCVGFFLAQDYEDKVLLIYNNHEVPQTLLGSLPGNIVLINNHIDLKTTQPYTTLGAIYRDAMGFVPKDVSVVCFMDDDDAYTSKHISLGVAGLLKAKENNSEIKAYRPNKFFGRYIDKWYIDKGMFVEPAIFVEKSWVEEKGFDLNTGPQHHGWLKPLMDEKRLYIDEEGTPTFLIDWSQDIPVWKTSGNHEDPENWNKYISNSVDHGDGIIDAVDVTAYYEKMSYHFPEYILPTSQKSHTHLYNTKQENMHAEVDQWIQQAKEKYPNNFTHSNVLEVGSLDINGSVRQYFQDCRYLGIDIGEGKGVDLVTPIHELIYPGKYNTIISTEMLEHDAYWKQSLHQMYENLKPGGLLIVTCAGPARAEHGTKRTTPGDSPFTTDYYRNISLEDFRSVLPEYFFSEQKLELVRGDADLRFVGVKPMGVVKPPHKYEDIVFVTAQPDDRTFVGETEIQIVNLMQWGLEDKLKVLIYWTPTSNKKSINTDWLDLRSRYPKVQFYFFREDPHSFTAQNKHNYASVVRPYMLEKLWQLEPELEKKAVFYLDSDVIFLDQPDVEKYLEGPGCFVTDTRGYLGVEYLREKAKKVDRPDDYFIELICKTVGIDKQSFISNDLNCGGAQYVLKGIVPGFWAKVEQDCINIRNLLMNENRALFVQEGIKRGLSPENAGIQSWCADMWAVWCNLLLFGHSISAPKFMDSAWAENRTERRHQDLAGVKILHMAGSGGPDAHRIYQKTNYRNVDGRVGKYYNRFPWEEDLSYVSPEFYSHYYAEAIRQTAIVRNKLISEGY